MELILSIPFNNSTRNVGLQKNTITSVPSVTPSYIAGPTINGTRNNALSFNGSTYWKSSGITLGTEATICFWSKTSTNKKMPWVLESDASNKLCLYENSYYTLNTGDGNTNLFKTDSNESISVLYDNTWHHFAVTFGDGVAKLYIDGLYKGTAITFRNPTTTNKPIKIGGGYQNGHTYDWNGGIADFRVYDHCLMERDIQRIYDGDTRMLQVSLPFNKDHRNVGLENVKPTSGGNFTIVTDPETSSNSAYFAPRISYVNIPHEIFMKNKEMSMTFFIKVTNWTTSYATPIGLFTMGNRTFTFLRNSKEEIFIFVISEKTDSVKVPTKLISLDTWYHFACVYEKGKMALYQNGKCITIEDVKITPSFTNVTLAILGAATEAGANQIHCEMSNVRFYNLALTDEDVQRIYQNEEIIILPSEYEKLEYIQSNGNQWIDTGIKGETRWVGCGQSSQNTTKSQTLLITQGGGNVGTFYGSVGNGNKWTLKGSPYSTNYDITSKQNFDILFKTTGPSGTIGDTSVNITTSCTLSTNWIISCERTTTYPYIGKIWPLKAYQQKLLVRNFIPSKRKSDNVIGMYDMVTRQFFTNSGTGSFTGA